MSITTRLRSRMGQRGSVIGERGTYPRPGQGCIRQGRDPDWPYPWPRGRCPEGRLYAAPAAAEKCVGCGYPVLRSDYESPAEKRRIVASREAHEAAS